MTVTQETAGAGAAKPSIEHGQRLEVADDVLSRRIGDETVILHLESEQYFGLNGVGTRLWDLLNEGTTLGHAVTLLAADYQVDPELVEVDVRAVLDDLMDSDLVVIVPDPAAAR